MRSIVLIFRVVDYEAAVLNPAKVMAMTAVDLLGNDAQRAQRIPSETQPLMSRDQYCVYLLKMDRDVMYEEI